MRHSHLEKILGKLEDLDSVNLNNLIQRLAKERRFLETVFNTIQEGILVIDPTGLILYCNQAASRLIGLNEKDLGKIILWKFIPDRSAHPQARPSSLRRRTIPGPAHARNRLTQGTARSWKCDPVHQSGRAASMRRCAFRRPSRLQASRAPAPR